MPDIIKFSEHADHRARINGAIRALVVEADISARHRSLQRSACIADASDRFSELPEHLRLPRISEVQAVCDGNGPRAGTNNIPGALGYSDLCPAVGVQVDVSRIAIGLHREGFRASLDPDDRRIGK